MGEVAPLASSDPYGFFMDAGDQITVFVAARLRDLRAAQGISMQQLGDAAAVHLSTIHLIEQGKRGFTLATGVRLAKALGVELSDLVREAETATR